MSTSTISVKGMTCDHCVRSVTQEIEGIDGVRSVAVDLGSGAVTVESNDDIDSDVLVAAVEHAGYEVES